VNAAKALKPLIEEARRNPRVHVALYRDDRGDLSPKGTLTPVECTRPRKKPGKPKKVNRRRKSPAPLKLGIERLTQPTEIKTKPGKWFVRFHYKSEGGEALYVDEGPMPHASAYAMANASEGSPVVYKDGAGPTYPRGRKVVLPSQKGGAK
jgi:hypothetical protein